MNQQQTSQTVTIAPPILADVQLCFFNKYRQLCVYDLTKSNPDDRIPLAAVLLDDEDSNRWVTIWKNGDQLLFECNDEAPDMGYEDYDFSADEGSIWLHNKNSTATPPIPQAIVIGMGDIRDLTSSIDVYNIPSDKDKLTFTCTADFCLRVYANTSPLAGDVSPASICSEK
jgi:hypothetical protein